MPACSDSPTLASTQIYFEHDGVVRAEAWEPDRVAFDLGAGMAVSARQLRADIAFLFGLHPREGDSARLAEQIRRNGQPLRGERVKLRETFWEIRADGRRVEPDWGDLNEAMLLMAGPPVRIRMRSYPTILLGLSDYVIPEWQDTSSPTYQVRVDLLLEGLAQINRSGKA